MRKALLSLAAVIAFAGQPTCAAFADTLPHGADGYSSGGLSASLGLGGALPSGFGVGWCYWHPYHCYVSG